MSSRKQRRRRQKDRRHDYEFVYVDEEGNEVPVGDEEASPNGKPALRRERPARDSKAASGRGGGGRQGRTVEPASLRRAARRGLLFAPFMFGVLYLLNRDLPLFALAVNTLILLAFFVPFGYLMDRVMYRAFMRRGARAAGEKPR
ncbi:MAG: hypothetical protein ABR583_04040 [Gaiellaceae bacterium]